VPTGDRHRSGRRAGYPLRPYAGPVSRAPDPAGEPAAPPAPSLLTRLATANLVVQIGIVVTGGLVRLTGSGLGCPTWPQCVPGSYTPVAEPALGWHQQVEFGNRMLTGVLVAVAVATSLAAWRQVRATGTGAGPLLWLGLAPSGGVLAQILLGGVTVLTDLNPATVAGHFLLSMALVAAATALHVLTRPAEPGPEAPTALRGLVLGLVAVTGLVLILGTVVTGSGPHAGDATRAVRFGLDPRAMSWAHADAVWLFTGLAVAVLPALRLAGAPRRARRAALRLLGVLAAQGVVGYLQYATGLPVPLVAGHLLGAALSTAAVTAVAVHALRRPAPS
jgi:heme a synthase